MQAILKGTAVLTLVIASLGLTQTGPAAEPERVRTIAAPAVQPAALPGIADRTIEPPGLRGVAGPSCRVTFAAALPALPALPGGASPGAFRSGDSGGPEPLSRESDAGLLP